MVFLYAIGLLCIAAVRPGSAQKTSEVEVSGFTLKCDKPLVFSGKDDQSTCFAKCTPCKCQAAVHMFSGQPGKPTCALMPAGANCKPERGGPHTLRLIVPDKPMLSIEKSHNIGGGADAAESLALYSPGPSSRTGPDACFAFCLFLKCNALQTDGTNCQLYKFTKRPEVVMSGKSPLCHATTVVYYENDKIAPTGTCVESG